MRPKTFSKRPAKKTLMALTIRKKFCRLCQDKTRYVDYKDVKRLEGFISDRGKISSTRFTGNCARHQRRVVEAINKARFISLIPYKR